MSKKKINEELLGSSPDPVISIDNSGRCIYLNPAAANLLKGNPEEHHGKLFSKVFPEAFVKSWSPIFNQVKETGKPVLNQMSRFEDNQRWYSLSSFPVFDENNKLKNVTAVAREITDLKKNLENLRTFKTLIENSKQGFGTGTPDGGIPYENPALYKMLGAKNLEEVKEHGFINFYDKETQKKLTEEIFPFLFEKGHWEGELPLTNLKGEKLITDNKLTVLYNDEDEPELLLNAVDDITKQKIQEQELAAYRDKLEELVEKRTGQLEKQKTKLQQEIEERSAIEEELRAANEQLQIEIAEREKIGNDLREANDKLHVEIAERAAVEEELRTANEQLVDEIGERKRMEEQLRIKNYSIENSINGFALGDLSGYITDVNPAFLKMWGIENKQEAIGRLYIDLLNDKKKAEGILQALEINGFWQGEISAVKTDGRVFYIELAANTVFNAKGEPVALASTFVDITDRYRQQEENLAEKNFSNAIINSLPGLFYMYAADGSLIRWNDNFPEITGFDDEELAKCNAMDFFDKKDQPSVMAAMQDTFREGLARIIAPLKTKTGAKIPYLFTGAKIKYRDRYYLVGHGSDYSEIYKSNRRLELSNLKFRSLNENLNAVIENKNISIWSVNQQYEIITINTHFKDYFKKAFGVKLKKGDNIIEKIPKEIPGLRQVWKERYDKALKGEIFKTEDQYEIEGATRYFDVGLNPIVENEKTTGAVVFVMEITESKKFAKILEQNERRFRTLVQATSQIVWQTLGDGAVISPQKSWMEFTSQTFEAIKGFGWLDAFHPDDREYALRKWNEAVQGKKVFEMEHRLRRHDGVYRHFEVRAVPMIDKDDNITDWIGTHTDITERVNAVESLKESQAINQTLLDAPPDTVALLDLKGNIVAINEIGAKKLGHTKDSIIGKNAYDLIPDEIAATRKKIIDEVIQTGQPGEIMDHRNDYWFDNRIYPVFDESGKKVVRVAIFARDISKLKQAEKKLVEQEEKFRNLFEADPDAIFLADPQTGKLIDANPAATELTGRPIDEIIGMHQMDLHPKEEQETITEKFKDIAQRKSKAMQLVNVLHNNGKIIPVEILGSVLNINDKPVAMGIFRDVTERVENQRKLAESEEQHRLIFESVTDSIIICKMDGNIVETNPAATKMYGYSKEEFKQLSPKHLVHPDYEAELNRFFKTLTQGKNFIGETIDVRKDRKLINVQVVGSVLPFKGESHLMAVTRDITSIKKNQEELKRNREQLQLITDTIPVLVSYVTPDHKYQFVNKGYEKWFGMKASDVIGKHAKDVVGEKAYKVVKKDMDKAFLGERVTYEKLVPYRKGGHRYTETTILPHNGSKDVEGIIVCVNDVTKRKETENELRTLLAELERSNKELEQFAYIASHDLQEPLRMVSSFLQLLERRYKEPLGEEGKEYIDFAVDGANRMKHLINDLLKFSRVGTRGKDFELVNLNLILKNVIDNLSKTIEESEAQIKFENLPDIPGDDSQFAQLLQNLISNALKFKSEKKPEVIITHKELKDHWQFSVKDNGIGIDERFFDKIFIIFQRLHSKEKYQGTGIGLAVCKKIVERHHGEISVKSKPGEGTEFIFTISKHLIEN